MVIHNQIILLPTYFKKYKIITNNFKPINFNKEFLHSHKTTETFSTTRLQTNNKTKYNTNKITKQNKKKNDTCNAHVFALVNKPTGR